MMYLNLIIFIALCLAAIQSHVIVSDFDHQNNENIDLTVQKNIDEYGNVVVKRFFKEVGNGMESLKGNFEKLKTKLIENQEQAFNVAIDNIVEYKNYRDYDLNLYSEKIEALNQEKNSNFYDLELKKSEMEYFIKEIQNDGNFDALENMKRIEVEYKNKMEKLKERRYLLTALMTQHCDNCDEVIREFKLDIELAQTDKDILELEEAFLKQSKENEKNLLSSKLENAEKLNKKYSELVDIYKTELELVRNTDEMKAINENIIDEWKEYAGYLENEHIIVRSKIENITTNSFDFNQLLSNDNDDSFTENNNQIYLIKETFNYEGNDQTDIFFIYKTKSNNNHDNENDESESNDNKSNKYESSFEWVNFGLSNTSLPKEAAIGGIDIDGSTLYIIRKKHKTGYYYGKYAFERNEAYVTNLDIEYGVAEFEILTSKNYGWCETDVFEDHNRLLPICRARYHDSLFPGTLLENGSCRIGFDLNVQVFTSKFDILTGGSCNY